MKRFLRVVLFSVVALCAGMQSTEAQWTKLTQFPGTRGASAFFFNATEGLVGTGDYDPYHGLPARIFFTEDGGATWQQAHLPNDQILGQVTDIYFRDRLHGWATIVESNMKGWSGVFRSTDGGRYWTLFKTAANALGIRETKRGIFYTDHGDVISYPNNGVVFSSDQGKTWSLVASSRYTLGVDFIDDANGYISATGHPTEPHFITSDSGRTWSAVESDSLEAWSVYADRFKRNFFVASEHNSFQTVSALLRTPVANPIPATVRSYPADGLTGGVAGSSICRSIIYIQGQPPPHSGPQGFVRTMDGGTNWKFVGGPTNHLDTRFAVTGRGAVVYAFDSVGNIYKTVNGADSTLSPSALPFDSLVVPTVAVRARRCDSAYASIVFGYRACDSSRVASVHFLNDSLHELSAPGYANDFKYFSHLHVDTLHILYQASLERAWIAQVRITIAQPDGYLEDTIIAIPLDGLAPRSTGITFLDTTAPKVLNFDSVSLCVSQLHKVTLANQGCADISVDNLQTIGGAFSLVSNFRPFVLTAGDSRSFLVRYAPDAPQQDQGALYAYHGSQIDSVTLTGIGYTPSRAVVLAVADTIPSSLCDSASFTIGLRNVACKPFKVLSVVTDTPFTVQPIAGLDSLHSGESVSLHLTFKPTAQGPRSGHVHVTVSYDGSGQYDTILNIVGNGTSGLPDLIIQSTQPKQISALDLGSISICADADTTILLTTLGCGAISVSNAGFDAQNGFSFSRAPAQTIAQTSNDTIRIHFHPASAGIYTANLQLTTSAGTKSVPCSITVTNDPGHITLASSQGVSALTCDSAAFSVSLTNSTCDSITIMAFHVSGADSNDFMLSSGLIGLATRGQALINGTFKPQDSLQRTATAILTIKHADGTTTDTTLTISATGIGVPGILVNIGAVMSNPQAPYPSGDVGISILVPPGSPTPVGTFDFDLVMNTDLLTPVDVISTTGGGWTNLAVHSATVTNTRLAHIHIATASDAPLPVGSSFIVVCQPYVTDSLKTSVVLTNPRFGSVTNTNGCLLTQSVRDTHYFTMNYACGDSTLSIFVGTQTLLLDRVSPNPTSGQVSLSFFVPQGYQNDGVLVVYDALGQKLSSQPLVFAGAGKQLLSVDLSRTRGEGVRYLLIRTPAGIITRNVILTK